MYTQENADWYQADMLTLYEDPGIAPHNRTSPVFKVAKKYAESWAADALRTTNTVHDHVPAVEGENGMFTSLRVWLRMIDTSASENLLNPRGLDVIRNWSRRSTARQRSALSQLLLSLNDHMTAVTLGKTESKIQFGPKRMPSRDNELLERLKTSTLGRPSTAPIVSAAQKKLEEKIKMANDAAAGRAAEMAERSKAAMANAERREGMHNPNASSIPMKWPMKEVTLESTTMHQQSTVVRLGMPERTWPSQAGMSPASILGRAIGVPKWHGDALYPTVYPSAVKSFPTLGSVYSYRGIPGMGDPPMGCPPLHMRESHLNYDGTLSAIRARPLTPGLMPPGMMRPYSVK